METEKQKIEQEIFRILDRDCEGDSTPIPDKLFEMNVKCEVWGFMCRMICDSFQRMRDTNGATNWECDAKAILGTKRSPKRLITMNAIRKYLMECQGADLIEYSKEVGDEITVKVNVTLLFGDCVRQGEVTA